MTNPSTLSTTWRRKSTRACWQLRAPVSTFTQPRDTLLEGLVRVVRALEGFARPTEASWTSTSAGEDALEQDLGPDPTATLLGARLADPIEVVLSLSLLVGDPSGAEHTLDRAGDLWVALDPDARLTIRLTLDVDLYAWRSWGQNRDNHETAARNAPRLRVFLERLQHDLGAQVVEISAPDYPGQVDAFGFHPPPDEGPEETAG